MDEAGTMLTGLQSDQGDTGDNSEKGEERI